MRAWIPINALWWLGLSMGLGVLAPWMLRWTQRDQRLETSPRKLFQRGELGLFGLLLTVPIVLDLRRSGLPTQLILANAAILGIIGLMAASAWLEDCSRGRRGLSNSDQRTWLDSRKLLFLVLSVAFTTEVLLEHSVQVWPR